MKGIDCSANSQSSIQKTIASLTSLDISEVLAAGEFTICSFEDVDESMLQQIMSLLSLAHYQTTPDDFMRLMDSPDVLVVTFKVKDLVLATAIINIEGGDYLSDLALDIAEGKRRPKGHLGAQRLTLLSVDFKAATQSYWRINRIAVHPKLQNKGYVHFEDIQIEETE